MAFAQQSKWGSIIAGISFVLVCLATLTPGGPPPPPGSMPVCTGWCDDPLMADFARNIVLFMPLGFGLRLAGVRMPWAILFGSALSATVELLQIRVVVGRDASFLDWTSNTIGTISGAVIAAELHRILLPRSVAATRFVICAVAAWIGVLALGAWGIQPAPTGFQYWGERTPRLRAFPPFRGALLSGRVEGSEMPSAPLPNEDILRRSMSLGQIRVNAVVLPGPHSPPAEIAPIVRVADRTQREILLLGRGGKELVFRYRARATALRLETPAFALERVFETQDGARDTIDPADSLAATLDHGHLVLSARTQQGFLVRRFDLSPGLSWSFFVPWDQWLGPDSAFVSMVWLGALLIPAGYWMGLASRGGGGRGLILVFICVASVVATVALIPTIFGLPASPSSEYVSALLGLGAGWVCSLLVRRLAATRGAVS